MDELAENSFISTEGVGGIEAAKTGAAECAAPLVIQGKGILEGSPATGAEEFGAQGFWLGDASGTNRIASDLAQNFAADAAAIGEYQGKKGVGDGTDC